MVYRIQQELLELPDLETHLQNSDPLVLQRMRLCFHGGCAWKLCFALPDTTLTCARLCHGEARVHSLYVPMSVYEHHPCACAAELALAHVVPFQNAHFLAWQKETFAGILPMGDDTPLKKNRISFGI